MSINIQTPDGLKKLADKTTKKNIKEALGYVPSNTPNINDYNGDTFYIADSKGNVIFKVDKDGVHTVNINVNEGITTPEDNLIIKDENGNIILQVDSDGISTTSVNTKDGLSSESNEFTIMDSNGNIILRVDNSGVATTKVSTNEGITSEDDNFKIIDSNGNIIFRIDKDGIHSVGLNINDKSLETIIEENTPSGDYNELSNKPEITEDNSNVLQIADKYGNVIAKIDSEGVHALNFYVGTGKSKVALEDGVNQEISTIKSTQTTMQTDIEANTEAINTKAHASHTHSYNNLTNKPNIVEDESSVLQITDNYGNIIATISAEGLNTVGFKLNGKEVALKLDLDNLQGTIGSANGIAPLDATGKVSIDYIPDSILGQLEYKGVWDPRGYSNPATNSAKGHYYIANTTGSYNPDGTSSPSGYDTGDWAVYNGTGWDKVDNTDAVTSVAGLVGPISVVSLVGALKGTTANCLAVGNHTHDYASSTHNHDSTYSKTGHTHSYNDLTNKPTIPTKTSQLTNDSDFATTSYVEQVLQNVTGGTDASTVKTSLDNHKANTSNPHSVTAEQVGTYTKTKINELLIHNHDSVYANKSHTHTEYQTKLKAGTGISIASDGTISINLASAESGSY